MPEQQRQRHASTASAGWTVVAASFGFALIQLDVTIVNVALPSIGSDLHSAVSGLQWVVDAYVLVFAALLLSSGFIGDRFGARRVYLAGLGLFGLASLACGLTQDAATLVAGRALQGVAAAIMLPSSIALINHAAGGNSALRARAVGWWTAAGGVAIAAGPIVGGLLLAVASWRSIFLVNIPVCIAGALLTLPVAETERQRSRGGFDPAGQLLAILALAGFIGAMIEVRPLGLFHPIVVGAVAVAAVAGAAFIAVESRTATPMLPLAFFRIPGFARAIGYGVAVNLTYYGTVFVLSLYLQQVLGYSPIRTGLAYLPLTATFIVVNVLSGWLAGRTGPRLPMVLGALIDAAGFVVLRTLGPDGGAGSAQWTMLLAFALLPAGMGLGVPAMTTAVLSSVDKARSGIAAGILNAARQAGGAAGVALFGALAGASAGGITGGLHASAAISIGLLLGAAALATRLAGNGWQETSAARRNGVRRARLVERRPLLRYRRQRRFLSSEALDREREHFDVVQPRVEALRSATEVRRVLLHQLVEEPHPLLARLHECNATECDHAGVARARVALEAPVGEHLPRLVDLEAGAGVALDVLPQVAAHRCGVEVDHRLLPDVEERYHVWPAVH